MVKCFRILISCVVIAVVIFPGDLTARGRHNRVKFAYTTGHLSLIDEFISQHQYSGDLAGWDLRWVTDDSSRITHRGLTYLRGNRIRNYTIAAHIQDFSLYSDWLFQSAQFRFFSRECTVYLGPALLMYLHSREQEIGDTPMQSSVLGMVSVNLYNRFAFRLMPALHFNTDFRLSVFSFTGKSSEDQETSNPAVLSGLAATDFSAVFNIQWMINQSLVANVAYAFRWTRVPRWNYFRALTDGLSINLGIRF